MSGPDRSDRRRSRRLEVILKIEYLEPADLLHDYITDLGEGGIFIRTPLAFPAEERLSFALSFPHLLEPINLRGIVRWRTDPDSDEQGVGVEFVFEQREQKQRLEQLLESLRQEEIPSSTPDTEPFRVLLVEDNAFARELFDYAIRKTLAETGRKMLEVYWATDGGEALQIARGTAVDLAIVDHYLPVMSGCEFVRYLRKQPQTADIPVLLVSGGGEEIRQQAYQSGADLFLDKPVGNKQLMQTLVVLLARSWRERGGAK